MRTFTGIAREAFWLAVVLAAYAAVSVFVAGVIYLSEHTELAERIPRKGHDVVILRRTTTCARSR